jgi:hypothetical protein
MWHCVPQWDTGQLPLACMLPWHCVPERDTGNLPLACMLRSLDQLVDVWRLSPRRADAVWPTWVV